MKRTPFGSRFPATHPRKGEFTFFPEKIWAHLILNRGFQVSESVEWLKEYRSSVLSEEERKLSFQEIASAIIDKTPKIHTIRQGEKRKVGDKFDPYVWTGLPYRSPQIIFAPTLEVARVEKFYTSYDTVFAPPRVFNIEGNFLSKKEVEVLAKNDGLSLEDFKAWFSKTESMSGQIIHF